MDVNTAQWVRMEQPEPATGWPEQPLSQSDAAAFVEDRAEVIGVWVMDHDEAVRSVTVPRDAPEGAVIDVVLETTDAFEMYSYSGGQWMDYGIQSKDDEEAPSMAGTLASYRLLEGETDLEFD